MSSRIHHHVDCRPLSMHVKYGMMILPREYCQSRTKFFQENILSHSIRLVRGTYTSKSNLKYAEKKKAEDITDKEAEERSSCSDPVPVRLTRGQSTSSQFNIRSSCFVCGSSSVRKEKLTPVTSGTGESTRKKVLKAAEDTNNDVVFQRMVAHPDLFAYDAKYHRI